jgi:hypothetical protein
MPNPFSRLWDQFQETKGPPAPLKDWASSLSAEQKAFDLPLTSASVRSGAVIRWGDLGKDSRNPVGHPPFDLCGHGRNAQGQYTGLRTHSPELAQWLIVTTQEWTGDIGDIKGLSSSKSDLDAHATLSDFAQARCAGLLARPSVETLQANLDWPEVNLTRASLVQSNWDGRVLMENAGGSHHFAAAQEIASQLGQPVPVSGKLQTVQINPAALAGLRQKYEMFIVSDDPLVKHGLFNALADSKISHFQLPMPSTPAGQSTAVLLPRHEPAAMRAAALLRREGFTDLGVVLDELSTGIHRHPQSALPLGQPLPSLSETTEPASATKLVVASTPAALSAVRRSVSHP